MRISFFAMILLFLVHPALAQSQGQLTDLVMATVRLSNAKSTATGFILTRKINEKKTQFVLVTAAHVFEKSEGEDFLINYRRKETDGGFARAPEPLKVRREKTQLWLRHAKQDVAVMRIEPQEISAPPGLSLDLLATAEDLKDVGPGDLVRCLVFPHASVFDPSQAAFPVIRIGCVASFPLLPAEKHPTFLVDYNSFEGDSGGPVVWRKNDASDGNSTLKILGLVQGQHFFNARYDLPYESGEFRKQLGMGIIAASQAIRETIDLLP